MVAISSTDDNSINLFGSLSSLDRSYFSLDWLVISPASISIIFTSIEVKALFTEP
jgi:hypothetical protein